MVDFLAPWCPSRMSDSSSSSAPQTARTGDEKHKLRRNRAFDDASEVQSALPSAATPHSRRVSDSSGVNLHPSAYDSRGVKGPIPIDSVIDRVVCGDSADVLGRLPPGFASLAITSPPYWNLVDYGVEGQIGLGSYDFYRNQLKPVWSGVARALRPNGKFALNVPLMPIRKEVSERFFGRTHTRVLLDLYSDLRQDILQTTDLIAYGLFIWEKQTTEKMFGSYPYPPNLYERNYIEFIAIFVKPGPPPKVPGAAKAAAKLTQKQWMDLTTQIWWMYPENVGRTKGHPAPFPEALPNRLVNMYSFPGVESAAFQGDIVLDPFAGWGTTCVAAKRCGRRFVGIDLSASFCNHAVLRIAKTSRAERQVIMTASRPAKTDSRQVVFQ